MPIDDCSHTFAELAQTVLPSLMTQMHQAIASATPVSEFLVPRQGVKTLLRAHGRAVDFPGCYVLLEGGKPLYVGISRKVFRRVWYHARGTKHFTATLAYSIAAHGFVSDLPRGARMVDMDFLGRLQSRRSVFRSATLHRSRFRTIWCCISSRLTARWNWIRLHGIPFGRTEA